MISGLFTPTKHLSVQQAALWGALGLVLTAIFSSFGSLVTDGVLDLHFLSLSTLESGGNSRLFANMAQGVMNVVWVTAALMLAARLMGERVSLLSMAAYLTHARWPFVLATGYLAIPGVGDQILALTFELMAAMPTNPDQVMASPQYLLPAMKLTALSVPLLLITVWIIWLMYEAYAHISQLPRRRAIPSFAVALFVAELLSKLTLF